MVNPFRRRHQKPQEREIERWLREQGLSPFAAAEDEQRGG